MGQHCKARSTWAEHACLPYGQETNCWQILALTILCLHACQEHAHHPWPSLGCVAHVHAQRRKAMLYSLRVVSVSGLAQGQACCVSLEASSCNEAFTLMRA